MTGHTADRHLSRQEKKEERKVSKAREETIWKKKKQTQNLLFLAALNCYILTIEVWIMYFHGFMTNRSPS